MTFGANLHPPATLRRALLATTLLCMPMMFAPAQAQTLAQETQPTNVTGGDEVIVTGSRLMRPDLSAPSPVTVIGEQNVKLSGNVTIERTINQFPQLAQGNTTAVNNGGGSGVLTANLRGLGATRTLTLVNGRRFIPTGSAGNVDLASIPDALVQRVDIISGGASAVYGSDAIAGAVNFILKDNFKGVEASVNYGITDRGDAPQQKYDLTIGVNAPDNRGNVALALSYTKQGSFTQADRDFSALPLADNPTRTGFIYSGSGNIPGTRIPLSSSQLAGLVGLTRSPNPTCSSVSSIRFLAGGIPTQYCQPEDTYNYAPYNLLQRPLSRYNVSALGHYDLTDHITAFAEAFYADTKNNYELAPESFVPLTPGAPGSQTLLVPNYANNPVLPAVLRQFFADNARYFDTGLLPGYSAIGGSTGVRSGTAAVVGAGRRADEFGTRQYYYERQAFDITGGLRGDFKAIGQDFRWEAFGQFMRTREDSRNVSIFNQARLSQAMDAVVDPSGNIVCRNNTSGCVPVNIFGVGSISTGAAAFLTPERDSSNDFKRTVLGASLSGALFNLPAGPVAVAIGGEYRRDRYRNNPSPFDLAGDYGTGSDKSLVGGYTVKEVFGELRVPILADMPFVDNLSAEGAVRYSSYSTIGSVLAWKAGGEYAPVHWARVRGAFNRAVRAPNVGELYSSISQGFTGGTDPCARASLSAPDTRSEAVRAMCVAQGINPADIATFQQSSLGLTQRSGGNPDLQEEKSNTYTIGMVISPPFLRRLNITVDYFNVEVNGAITTVNVQQTLNDCFTNLDINSATCQAVHRLPGSGQIEYVSTQNANIGALKTSGIDAQLDYRLPLPFTLDGESAQLSLQAVASWMFKKSLKTLSNAPAQDCAGYYGAGCSSGSGGLILPDFKLNLNATFSGGPFSWRVVGRMIGDLRLYPTAQAYVTKVPAVWYVDSTLSFNIDKRFQMFVGVNNIGDRQPPILGSTLVGDANVDVSLYDVAGRRYFAGATIKF
ncbi:TonB-dependent receptor plug domain-containing protein [Sphingobium aquiterrae]|uniref:TonB-dependent receptor plug domain-containing protein n=1 Tax=Sphingobium aquiterrae TaxID=2038656 RepID=UPI0030196669